MKVAICFSGLPRGNYKENIARYREVFPDYDFFFSTWRGYEIEGEKYTIYEEPESDYLKKIWNERRIKGEYHANVIGRGYKQIMGHCLQLLFDVPKEYDMIVRCRYDSIINEKIDWKHFVKKSYETNTIFGFNATEIANAIGKEHWDLISELTNIYTGPRLNDMLIFHKREHLSITRAFDLFQKEMLQPAEVGWFQVFPDAIISSRKFAIKAPMIRCFVGGIDIERTEEQIKMIKESGLVH